MSICEARGAGVSCRTRVAAGSVLRGLAFASPARLGPGLAGLARQATRRWRRARQAGRPRPGGWVSGLKGQSKAACRLRLLTPDSRLGRWSEHVAGIEAAEPAPEAEFLGASEEPQRVALH